MPQMMNHLQSGLMYHIFLQQAWPMPSSLYLALCSNPPTNIAFNELSVSNYARQNLGVGAGSWLFSNANSGLVINKSPINFPVAVGTWGWVSGAVIVDQVLGYNQFFAVVGPPAIEIGVNSQYSIPASSLIVRLY